MVQVNAADGNRYLEFRYHRRIGNPGVQYAVQVSADLSAWETTPGRFEEIGVASDDNGVTETVTVRRLTVRGL